MATLVGKPSMARGASRVCLIAPALLALIAGSVGYSGVGAWIALAPLITLAWGMSADRRHAFLIAFVYYAAAGRGLFRGGGVFFAGELSPAAQSLSWGAIVWLAPTIILALVWASLWSAKRTYLRLLLCLVVLSVPPVGLIGWANPLSSAGVIFPGTGYAGLVMMVASMVVFVRVGQTIKEAKTHWALSPLTAITLASAVLGSVLTNVIWAPPPAPAGWIGVRTHLGDTDGWVALQSVQDAVAKSIEQNTRVVVLPEAVGGDWDLNKLYWERLSPELAKQGVTVIIGADRAIDQRKRVNALMTVGREGGREWPDRAPVPLGMWNPLSSKRHIVADWTGTGVRRIDSVDSMYLICYEQLLVWPVLRSALLHPRAIIGASNLWWAKGTTIPGIQRATLYSWGRLFSIPVVMAVND